MPRVRLQDPAGYCWDICTRNTETTLFAWFDEVLPFTYWEGSPLEKIIWPRIMVQPMWAWKKGPLSDPDWLCDSRVIGMVYEFPAKNGAEGLRELAILRRKLEGLLVGRLPWESL